MSRTFRTKSLQTVACLSDGPVIPRARACCNAGLRRWNALAGAETPAWKSICKLNDSGSGQTGAGGTAAGEERVRKGNDRSEGGGEEGNVHVHLTNIGQ